MVFSRARSDHHGPFRPGVRRSLRGGAMLALAISGANTLPAQSEAHANVVAARTDTASDSTIRLPRPTGCIAAIPPASMHRVPVFLHAWMPERGDSTLMPQADLMAQDVADEFRKLLGATGTVVPIADTNFVWYSVPTALTVVAHRNGDMTRRADGSGGDSAATLLFTRAFDAARARGAALVEWPDGLADDSALVHLTLWPDYVGDIPEVMAPGATMRKFAVFSLTEPERSPAYPLPNQRQPVYPYENERRRIEGSVLMQFVVDTMGRAEPGSIRELWPAGRPRLGGDSAYSHDEFVYSVRVWLREYRFRPARIGTCAVKQRVQQPLEFKKPRRT
jgi:hypothetical protein